MSAALQQNPLYTDRGIPSFDRIRTEHVEPAIRAVLKEAEEAFRAHESQVEPTWESAVEALDEIGLPLAHAWGPVSHLNSVLSSPALREARLAMQPLIVAFSLRASQSRPIYEALVALRDGEAGKALAPWQRRVLEQRIRGTEHRGIALEGAERERFNKIATRLSEITSRFADHLLDARKDWSMDIEDAARLEGIPASTRRLFAQQWAQAAEGRQANPEKGPWRITLDLPSYLATMQHVPDRSVREAVMKAWVAVASAEPWDNRPLIREILKLRREQASLLGYATYAELSLADKMAESDEVYALSETLRSAAWPHAEREHEELVAFARGQGFDAPLERWDLLYWRERLKEARFAFTAEELKAYFPMPRVLTGLFSLVEELFGVRVVEATESVPRWHEDVRYYRVEDRAGHELAGFFLDPYSRPETKRGGAWMNICLSRRRRADGTLQLPVAYLVCNATPPAGAQPALMTFNEVLTLFHEFGHGLHHMLTTVDFEEISGVSGVEWDAVELPSQFMENWCYHRATVRGMSGHVESGAPLPEALFEKLVGARNYFAANDMLRQLHLGLTDMALHDGWDPESGEDPQRLLFALAERTQVVPLLEEDQTLCAFAHIFAGSYAAGYYSYKWAEVLSADAFEAFVEAGLENPEARADMGERFRDAILARGGSADPRELYREFRGRDADPRALLRQYQLDAA